MIYFVVEESRDEVTPVFLMNVWDFMLNKYTWVVWIFCLASFKYVRRLQKISVIKKALVSQLKTWQIKRKLKEEISAQVILLVMPRAFVACLVL